MEKIRIVQRYSPVVGTWYIIQKKIFFWWFDLPYAFNDFKMARQFYNDFDGEYTTYCQTIITNLDNCYDEKHYKTTTLNDLNWFLKYF